MQLRSHSSAPAHRKRELQPIHASLDDGNSMLKPMLTRLETALGSENLMQKMVLLSRPNPPRRADETAGKTINFVVGYNGSANSQGALDIALWMAHQTRMVKPNAVVVHVVYVVDQTKPKTIANADRILWQARCLSSEWRGSLNAHLRVGHVATELSQVAEELQAEVLMVGCESADHRLVQQLAHQTPCSVLGLPQ
jgi:hypothetical protein